MQLKVGDRVVAEGNVFVMGPREKCGQIVRETKRYWVIQFLYRRKDGTKFIDEEKYTKKHLMHKTSEWGFYIIKNWRGNENMV